MGERTAVLSRLLHEGKATLRRMDQRKLLSSKDLHAAYVVWEEAPSCRGSISLQDSVLS